MTNRQVLQFSCNESFDYEPTPERRRSSSFIPEQRSLQPVPSSVREPCSAMCTSLRAAISMSSPASSLAKNAERR